MANYIGNNHNNGNGDHHKQKKKSLSNDDGESLSGELAADENFLTLCSQELLARGTELLKRTRKGPRIIVVKR